MADDGSITSGDMSAAFSAAEGDSPSSDPSPIDTTADSSSADAIVPPADPALGEVTSTQPGVPPEQRWPSILENARREAATKAEEAWKPYEWAKQVDQQQFDEMVGFYQQANADPVTFLQELAQSLSKHPVHGEKLRSLAGRQLAQMRQPREPEMVRIALEDGTEVLSPRNPQEWLAFHQQKWNADVEQKLQPLKTLQQQAEQREASEKATAFATTLTGNLTKLPGFTEHKADIAKYIASARLESDHPAEVRAAALEAYTAIVVPKLSTTVRQGVLSDLHHQAGATTVNPSHASTAAPKSLDDMSTKEALQAEFARMSR